MQAGPYHGYTGTPLIFDASKSYDPDGYIASYSWQFGDGNVGYGKKVNHSYEKAGSYNVTLEVRDEYGAISKDNTVAIIEIDNMPPSVEIEKPKNGFYILIEKYFHHSLQS